MHSGHYVFAQITKFLPKRYFERLTVKYDDRTQGWSLTHWHHLLVLSSASCLDAEALGNLQIDIVMEIPVFYRITNAQVHDVNFMDWLTYEPLVCYVFDRGNFDLARFYEINCSEAFFIIREKFHPTYEIESGIDFEEREDNVLRDQTVRFTDKRN